MSIERTNVDREPGETGEPQVHITGHTDTMYKLLQGVSGYLGQLRYFRRFGIETRVDPADVQALAVAMSERTLVAGAVRRWSGAVRERARVTEAQANLAHQIAQTMLDRAQSERDLRAELAAVPGSQGPYGMAYEFWERAELALRPEGYDPAAANSADMANMLPVPLPAAQA